MIQIQNNRLIRSGSERISPRYDSCSRSVLKPRIALDSNTTEQHPNGTFDAVSRCSRVSSVAGSAFDVGLASAEVIRMQVCGGFRCSRSCSCRQVSRMKNLCHGYYPITQFIGRMVQATPRRALAISSLQSVANVALLPLLHARHVTTSHTSARDADHQYLPTSAAAGPQLPR